MKTKLWVFAIVLISCNDKKQETKFVPKSDTTKVLAMYVDLSDTSISSGPVFQIVRDIIIVDSSLKVNVSKDSVWWYKPKKDTNWFATKPPYICTDSNVDSCLMKLSETIKTLKKNKPK